MITFTHSHYSKELDKLSNKELEDKFEVLKKPWWNNIYEKKLHKNKKLLSIIFLLFIRRDFSWYGIKLIYKTIKAKKEEFEN